MVVHNADYTLSSNAIEWKIYAVMSPVARSWGRTDSQPLPLPNSFLIAPVFPNSKPTLHSTHYAKKKKRLLK